MNEKIFPESKWKKLIDEDREKRLSRDKFFKISEPHENEVWADIGCGPGYFALPIAKKVNKVFAVDISEEMLKILGKRAEENSMKNIEYVKSNGEIFPLNNDLIDRALLANVFHEFNDRKAVARELNRLLHPKGYIFIIDWKYQAMDFGPRLEQRIPRQEVIREFITNGFTFIHDWEIYEFFYVLGFRKTKEIV